MKQLFKIQKAIKFATKTHEVYQKQKRKGKNIAYITHPLTVGLILAHVGAEDDVICAGILHDTIEDSIEEKKVSFEMIKDRFGEDVANLVLAVTETDKSLPWEERKRLAKEHIKTFSHEAVLVKSADVLANTREIIQDYEKDGEQIFVRFNAPKEKLLKNYLETITILIEQWPGSSLMQELRFVSTELARMAETTFMSETPARIIEYRDYDENVILECPICKWKGKPEGHIEYYNDLFDVSCPNCDKMLLIVSYPLVTKIEFFGKIGWNITFISEEIGKIKTSLEVKEQVLSICDAISSEVLSKIGDVDNEILIAELKHQLEKFHLLIKELKNNANERMAYMLLITHVADILALIKEAK